MNCQVCNTPGIRNIVLFETFYYCRNCKEEIKEETESKAFVDTDWLWSFSAAPFKGKPTFKVGDKVKIQIGIVTGSGVVCAGDIGHIKEIITTGLNYKVEFNNGIVCTAYDNEMELF